LATIKDVAKQANVSIATVSHVINKTRYVSPELVERVKSVMESLDYQPNNTARNLRSNKIKSIGLIIPDITSPFFSAIIKSVEKVTTENGYGLIVCNTEDAEYKFEMYIKLMTQDKVDGLIITPTCECLEHINELQNCNIPFVFIDRKAEGVEADVVVSDNIGGAYKAAHHLIKSGHEKIALIIGEDKNK
jgi:LacI family transcriptional regulator